MIAVVWSLLTSRIAGPLGIGAAALLLVWGTVERVQLAGARLHARQLAAEVAGAKADLSTCKANLQTELGAEAAQEAAVRALKAASDAKAADLKKAAHDALSARAVAESRAKQIEGMKVPGDQTCPAVDAVLLGRPQ